MATGELLEPGVKIIQTFKAPAPTFVRPTLAPCVVGPAFEVVNVLSTDGTINSKARYGAYAQLGKSITESSFPDPRGNIDELDVLENSIRTFLLFGGSLQELMLAPGTSFLASSHVAGKAAIRTAAFGGAVGLDLRGKVLVLAFDNPVKDSGGLTEPSKDVTIVFVGTGSDAQGPLLSQDCADQINEQVGQTVATVVGDTPNDKVQIASPTFGALSSVTVRAGASANTPLQIGYSGGSAAHEERVEGSGYRGQISKTTDTLTPWIEFYQGDYFLDGVSTAFASKAGLVAITTDGSVGAFVSAKHDAVTFAGGTPSVSLKVGDYVFVDGQRLKGGEVMKVEAGRFKVGTINTALSTADENGRYTSKIYDVQQVGTPFDLTPFAPQFLYFVANGLDWKKASAVAAKVAGAPGQEPTAATQASVETTSAGNGPFILTGKTLHYVVTIDGVETEGTFTFLTGYQDDGNMLQVGAKAAMDKVVAAIGTSIPGVVALNSKPPQAGVPQVGGELILKTVKSGRLQSITVKADGLANGDLGFSTSTDVSSTGADVLYSGLAGKLLKFQLDENPHIHQVTLADDSLELAIEEINTAVGATVASKNTGGTHLVLTSPLAGYASSVAVLNTGVSGAEDALGLSTTVAHGSGRPYPDVYLDDASVLHVGSELLRDLVTGLPLDQDTNKGTLYIQYKALRKDVSPSAVEPGVLRISDTDTLSQVLDPLTEDNPLGLGLFLALINAPNFEAKGLGLDEVTGTAPGGTEAAWARAAGMLEAEEVYAIAPLTQDEVVHGLWATHASVMSQPDQGGERIVFINKAMPTRQNPRVVVSGTSANSTTQTNQALIDMNPSAALVAAGVSPVGTIPVAAGLYLELAVAGETRRYNVVTLSGSLVNFRTDFIAGENNDGFYSTATLNVSVVNAPYSLKLRGASISVPGSNPPRYDYAVMADTVAEANASFRNRRLYSVFPDTVKTLIQGVEKSLPGYYACAAIAGMVAAQPPQQGFTNFPITGITGVVGTGPEDHRFTKRQLNIMAGGGTYLLVQDVVGGAVYCRHQVSTDLTSIETRELSITKVVDFTAKILRLGVRRFIGTHNINKVFLDTLSTTVHAILKFLEDLGVLNGSNLNNIAQDKTNPDTVLIDVTLDVPFPCNYIRVTLIV